MFNGRQQPSSAPRAGVCYLLASCLVVAWQLLGINPVAAEADEVAPTRYGVGEFVVNLACPAINESSGLASSRRENHLLWTHNDSGNCTTLYAFDATGADLGKVAVEGAKCQDWEDMAAFRLNGEPWLLIADTGDNGRLRDRCQLYLLPEPDPAAGKAAVEHVIHFTYEGGSSDCEAVAVDDASGQVILVAKDWSMTCKVFALPLPTAEQLAEAAGESAGEPEVLVARQIGELQIPGVTSIDISPDGLRAVVLTYLHAYEYPRRADESWVDAFARPGHEIKLPVRKQSEAICFGADGFTLYCTSEASPTPLYRAERTP